MHFTVGCEVGGLVVEADGATFGLGGFEELGVFFGYGETAFFATVASFSFFLFVAYRHGSYVFLDGLFQDVYRWGKGCDTKVRNVMNSGRFSLRSLSSYSVCFTVK